MPNFRASDGADYNGDFIETGTHNGAPYYQIDASHFAMWDGSEWYMAYDLGATTSKDYAKAGDTSGLPVGLWDVRGGASPAPTVAAIAAPAAASNAAMMMWARTRRR